MFAGTRAWFIPHVRLNVKMHLLNGDSANRKLTYSNAARRLGRTHSCSAPTARPSGRQASPRHPHHRRGQALAQVAASALRSFFLACARSPVVAICQSIRFSGSCVRLHAIVPATVDAGGLGGLRSNNGFPGSDVLTHRFPWVFRGQSKNPKKERDSEHADNFRIRETCTSCRCI